MDLLQFKNVYNIYTLMQYYILFYLQPLNDGVAAELQTGISQNSLRTIPIDVRT